MKIEVNVRSLPAKKELPTRDIVPSGPVCEKNNYPCLHIAAIDGTSSCVYEIAQEGV